jgi:hypothetical protein
MPHFTPQFPAFDNWQKMSESEQDALLARMERARRRRGGLFRLLAAVLLTGAVSFALYLISVIRF